MQGLFKINQTNSKFMLDLTIWILCYNLFKLPINNNVITFFLIYRNSSLNFLKQIANMCSIVSSYA